MLVTSVEWCELCMQSLQSVGGANLSITWGSYCEYVFGDWASVRYTE